MLECAAHVNTVSEIWDDSQTPTAAAAATSQAVIQFAFSPRGAHTAKFPFYPTLIDYCLVLRLAAKL